MNVPAQTDATVLIVDDDKAFCAALAAAFRRRGFKTLVAHDGADGLTEAKAWTPTHAVVDLRMPGSSGLDLTKGLSALNPQLKIVMLTGYGSIATAIEAIKLGAVHYLSKPAAIEEIIAAFDRTQGVVQTPLPETQTATLDQLEWEHLQRVLTDCNDNISEAARRLGLHRRSLQRKLARGRKIQQGIDPEAADS